MSVVLCVLDGWGYSTQVEGNAILAAKKPNWDRLVATSAFGLLDTCGEAVGLPHGQMGNSEVGHMHMGAGRIVRQDLPRIDHAIATKEFDKLPALRAMIQHLKKSGKTCHVMGLYSDGGVHSHQSHILHLIHLLNDAQIPTKLHLFLDGRDTPPQSAKATIADLLKQLSHLPFVSIGTIGGRYYGMDRDNRWERVQKAYDAMVAADAPVFDDPLDLIAQSYAQGTMDEFVIPHAARDFQGVQDGDALVMMNFRADRARQILRALLQPDFSGFERQKKVAWSDILGVSEYAEDLNPYIKTLFPSQVIFNGMGDIVAHAGKKQLRIAETEKYPHVTFFFNGGQEEKFEGEKRIMVPSPKVATYDMKPEMSAFEVTSALTKAIESKEFDFIVVNFANTDMVGHTGNFDAAVRAVQAIDACLGQLEAAVRHAGGMLLVTADHGNAEQMTDHSGEMHTAHSHNLVPVLLINGPKDVKKLKSGSLVDVGPTLLELMNIGVPSDMTGHSLLVHE